MYFIMSVLKCVQTVKYLNLLLMPVNNFIIQGNDQSKFSPSLQKSQYGLIATASLLNFNTSSLLRQVQVNIDSDP